MLLQYSSCYLYLYTLFSLYKSPHFSLFHVTTNHWLSHSKGIFFLSHKYCFRCQVLLLLRAANSVTFNWLHSLYKFLLTKKIMKFGKRLKQQIQETLPEWKDEFLSYKELKKLVRLISSTPPPENWLNGSPSPELYCKPESEFVYLLNNQIDKFNTFFMEKEEDFIIRHKVYNIQPQFFIYMFKHIIHLLYIWKYILQGK